MSSTELLREAVTAWGRTRWMLARLLPGNEIMREVCRELRARQACGAGSDPPVVTKP